MKAPRTSFEFLFRPRTLSFFAVVLVFVLVGWLHLATPLLSVLFCCFALGKIYNALGRIKVTGKWATIAVFSVVLLTIAFGLGKFVKQAVVALPHMASIVVPSVIEWTQARDIELPFTDYEDLKKMLVDEAKDQAHYIANVANFAKGATTQFVFLIIGVVVAVSIFLNAQMDLDHGRYALKNNLYSLICQEVMLRFSSLYQSFSTVMGAQILISAINTVFTSIFVLSVGLPHAPVVIGITFLCGLLPVLGNLISNTVIVGISFTISPKMALWALTFLVVIHKLEYFLNSKIIGDRIRNPIWLTLLGLILGEKLMGIPGMILAPVILNYLKVEASKIEVRPEQ